MHYYLRFNLRNNKKNFKKNMIINKIKIFNKNGKYIFIIYLIVRRNIKYSKKAETCIRISIIKDF